MSDQLLDNACAFAARGHRVLPLHGILRQPDSSLWGCTCRNLECQSPGKHPHSGLVSHGLKDATVDIGRIERWYQTAPSINFGVCTDGLVVLDSDGSAGGATLGKLAKKHGDLPSTWMVATGGFGGRHRYFLEPAGVEVRNSARKLGPGLDVRARGGYVVIRGSTHHTGHRYRWFNSFHPRDHEPAVCPGWLVTLIAAPKANGQVSDYTQLARRVVDEGARNATLCRLAGHLVANLVPRATVEELLDRWGQVRCNPALTLPEIKGPLDSLYEKHMREHPGLELADDLELPELLRRKSR